MKFHRTDDTMVRSSHLHTFITAEVNNLILFAAKVYRLNFSPNLSTVNVLFPAYNHYVGCKTVDYKDSST